MKHCCVIGGAGFLGSHVVEALALRQRRVTVVGRMPVPARPLPRGVRYIPGDYGEKAFLLETLKGVDEIINLSYSTVPSTSFDDPVRDILANLPAAVNLFEVASALGVERVVIVSSGGTVYGQAERLPIVEEHPTNPISPYGVTKLAIEKYGHMFMKLEGLPVVTVRPSNAYGERQRPFAGQGFVATAMASILRDQEIVLYGDSGTVRDYVHATDVATGIVAALESGKPGVKYNIGSGEGRSNRDVLDAIYPLAQAAGLKPRITTRPARQFDVEANVLDCGKLRHDTGWETKMPFRVGVERTWRWFMNAWQQEQMPKAC
ncbi:MAG TPA: NAD-dependent epimerase/dehydratase family protein [Nitrospira sp.]|nr:NAD-dependent epimerase/dehydratase family protein [Nitrospira sp.]